MSTRRDSSRLLAITAACMTISSTVLVAAGLGVDGLVTGGFMGLIVALAIESRYYARAHPGEPGRVYAQVFTRTKIVVGLPLSILVAAAVIVAAKTIPMDRHGFLLTSAIGCAIFVLTMAYVDDREQGRKPDWIWHRGRRARRH